MMKPHAAGRLELVHVGTGRWVMRASNGDDVGEARSKSLQSIETIAGGAGDGLQVDLCCAGRCGEQADDAV